MTKKAYKGWTKGLTPPIDWPNRQAGRRWGKHGKDGIFQGARRGGGRGVGPIRKGSKKGRAGSSPPGCWVVTGKNRKAKPSGIEKRPVRPKVRPWMMTRGPQFP